MRNLIISIRMLLIMTVLTGFIYPLFITLTGHAFFNEKISGNMIKTGDNSEGSVLIGQNFTSDRYFHGRPSASDYNAIPSGAGNLSPTSNVLLQNINDRKNALGGGNDIPSDLLTSSGSGLDPHISPEAAYFQLDRVAKARGFNNAEKTQLKKLIIMFTEQRDFFILGEKRVNVLLLNASLDKMVK